MVKERSYFRNFATMLSGNFLSQLIPFAIGPILAHLYSPEDFAQYASYLAIAGVIGIIASGRLELAIPITKTQRTAEYILYTGLIIMIVLTTLSFLVPIFGWKFEEMYSSPGLSGYLISIPIAVLSYGLLGLANSWVLRQRRYNAISLSKIAQSGVNNGLAAVFGFLGWGAVGLIVGWLTSQFIAVIVLLFAGDTKLKYKKYSMIMMRSTLKENKDFPLINSLHAFTDIFASQFILYWIISGSFGLLELGLFTMMYKYIMAPISMITSSVSQIFYAESSKAMNSGENVLPILKKTVFTSASFSIPFILILAFFGPYLFKLVFGAQWEMSGEYARMIIPMLILIFVISPISSLPIIMNEQKKAYFFAIGGYILSIGTLILVSYFNWNFGDALFAYSCSIGLYYLSLLIWYMSLMRRYNAHIS